MQSSDLSQDTRQMAATSGRRTSASGVLDKIDRKVGFLERYIHYATELNAVLVRSLLS